MSAASASASREFDVWHEIGSPDLGVHVSIGAEQASHASDSSSHVDESAQHVLFVTAQGHLVEFVDFVLELFGCGVEGVEVPVEHGHKQQHRGETTDLTLILDALVVFIEERDRLGVPGDGPILGRSGCAARSVAVSHPREASGR